MNRVAINHEMTAEHLRKVARDCSDLFLPSIPQHRCFGHAVFALGYAK